MDWPRVESSAATDTRALGPLDDLGWACLLMLLGERAWTSHELCERLEALGQAAHDPTGVELVLQALERSGLARAVAISGADHAFRSYQLTAVGTERLRLAADDLRETLVVLERFLARCGERLVP